MKNLKKKYKIYNKKKTICLFEVFDVVFLIDIEVIN